MVKQWKRSLSQSDILSDGTPFDGSNIDAAISSRSSHDWDPQGRIDMPISEAGGGIDWSSISTWEYMGRAFTDVSESTDASISVTGSGVLTFGSVMTPYPSYVDIGIVADGSSVLDFSNANDSPGEQPYSVHRSGNTEGAIVLNATIPFSSSIELKLNNTDDNVRPMGGMIYYGLY